jgi:hypothetical protein
MIGFSKSLSKNKAIDVYGLYLIRDFKDGITFLNLVINLDLFKGDHNPKFKIQIIFMNINVIEIDIYDVRHEEQKCQTSSSSSSPAI